jgi:dTDP-4-dehydrorhamnose reductase
VGLNFTESTLLYKCPPPLQNGQQIRCAIDQLLTPVDIQYVIKAIIFVIETRRSGVLHVSGSEVVTHYELFKKLLQYVPEQDFGQFCA